MPPCPCPSAHAVPVPCRAAPLCLITTPRCLIVRIYMQSGVERAAWAWRTTRSCPPVHRNMHSKSSSNLVILGLKLPIFSRCAGFAKNVIMGIFPKVPKSRNFEA